MAKELKILLTLIVLTLNPSVSRAQGLCSSYKKLKDTDTTYSFDECFKLNMIAAGLAGAIFLPAGGLDQQAYLIVKQSEVPERCNLYEVDKIDLILTAYRPFDKPKATRQPLGLFKDPAIEVFEDVPPDACDAVFTVTARPRTRSFTNVVPRAIAAGSTLETQCDKTAIPDQFVISDNPETLTVTIPNKLINKGVWALWKYNFELFSLSKINVDVIAEISYRNKMETTRTVKKMVGLLGATYSYEKLNQCQRITADPKFPIQAYKITQNYASDGRWNLCRCLKLKLPILPPGFKYTTDVENCLDLQFNHIEMQVVASLKKDCRSTILSATDLMLHEVIFSSYNEKEFPYGRWEPVIAKSNPFWKSEKCFYNIERAGLPPPRPSDPDLKPEGYKFYKKAFGEIDRDNFPRILHLIERPGNENYFTGKLSLSKNIKTGANKLPYIPKNVQIQVHALVSGKVTDKGVVTNFRRLITRHLNYLVDSTKEDLTFLPDTLSPPRSRMQLNEEYTDELNYIFVDQAKIDHEVESIYKCTTSEPRKDQLCRCFTRTRENIDTKEISQLIEKDEIFWTTSRSKESCFDIKAEFRKNGIHAGQHAVVAFLFRCPFRLEVLETAIEALSHNGIPFATNWDEVKLGYNSDPDNEEEVWSLETCKKLANVASGTTTLRETWIPVTKPCTKITGLLVSQKQLEFVQESSIFHSNRPLAGSKKGTDSVKDSTFAFCALFKWEVNQFREPRKRDFEFQFVAQTVVENLALPETPKNRIIVTVRSERFQMPRSDPTTNPDGTTNFRLPNPQSIAQQSGRTDEIDLNSEYYDYIRYGQPDKECVEKPPVFDEFNDEICTCFYDHPARGIPDSVNKDILLEQQAQTSIVTSYSGQPWKLIVKINFAAALNKKYGPYEVVMEALTPIEPRVDTGLPVGRWESSLYVGSDPHCSAGNIKYGHTLVHSCTIKNSAALYKTASGHDAGNLPNIFHFQNPWLDDYLHLCVLWEFIPPRDPLNPSVVKLLPDQYFQFYAQIIFEERVAGHARSKKWYSAPVHGKENVAFLPNGVGMDRLKKPQYVHDDDFRIQLHKSYANNERATDCPVGDEIARQKLPLPKIEKFDTFTCRRFHSHPYVKRIDLDDEITSPVVPNYKDCFTLDAFPLKKPENFHVRFRQYDKTGGSGSICKDVRGLEMLLSAVDQDGNPVGVHEGSFSIYDESFDKFGDADERCVGEDVLKHVSAFTWREGHACHSWDRVKDLLDVVRFVDNRFDLRPTVYHIVYNLNNTASLEGNCFTWYFDKASYKNQFKLDISLLQFIGEVFVPNIPGKKEGRIFVVRSPKYKINAYAPNLSRLPKCHDSTLLTPSTSSLIKIDKPTTQPELDEYNLQINEDLYRACKQFTGLSDECVDDTHVPPPVSVTNPPVIIRLSTQAPVVHPRPTYAANGNVPEKIFHGCLSTKGCIAPEDYNVREIRADCIEKVNCKHVIAYGKTEGEDNAEDEIVMELYAETQGWIAMAFSTDKKMGGDYVVECVRGNLSTETILSPDLYHSWNHANGTHNNNKRLKSTGNIRLKESVQSKTSIYCKYYIKKKFTIENPFVPDMKQSFDLESTKYCLLVAWSERVRKFGPQGNIGIHLPKNRYPCNEEILFSRRFTPTPTQVLYFQAHGVFMTVAFVFFMSVGNFIARYYKEIFPEKSCIKIRRWHLCHICFVLLALICIIVGSFFHVSGMAGWESLMGKTWFHTITGYVVVILFFVNFLMAFCLRKKSTDRAETLAIVHTLIGYSVQVLAHLLIAEVHKIPFSSVSCVLGYMGIAWTILYVFLNIFMSYHYFWVPCITGNPKDGDAEVNIFAVLTQSRIHQKFKEDVGEVEEVESSGNTVRKATLIIYAGISFLFMLTMSLIILIPPVGPCFVGERPLYFEKGEEE